MIRKIVVHKIKNQLNIKIFIWDRDKPSNIKPKQIIYVALLEMNKILKYKIKKYIYSKENHKDPIVNDQIWLEKKTIKKRKKTFAPKSGQPKRLSMLNFFFLWDGPDFFENKYSKQHTCYVKILAIFDH